MKQFTQTTSTSKSNSFLAPGRTISLAACLCTLAGTIVFAQSSAPSATAKPDDTTSPTVSSKVRVVNVLATVRDKHGKLVPNLVVSDFTLLEDNKPVAIQYFSKEANLPLKLGLLVDTSMSQRDSLDQEKSASKTFIDQVLREQDKAFLIHFDREVELLQDLTSSRPKLESALASLQIASPYEQDSSGQSGSGYPDGDSPRGGGRGSHTHHAGTTLYDAVYLASDELMKNQSGRKALVILSDGVDRGSKESLETAIEAAQRADTLVYAVFFKGQEEFGSHRGGFGFPGGMGGPMGGGRRGGGRYPQQEPPPDGKKVLERIAKETGGRLFEVSKKDPIDQIYSSIEEELRNQYNLGYTPAKSDTAGYHKLVLKTNQKDDAVQTRDGFYLDSD
jgi:VWFA-related protein